MDLRPSLNSLPGKLNADFFSADNLSHSLDPDLDNQITGSYLDPNCVLMVFLYFLKIIMN